MTGVQVNFDTPRAAGSMTTFFVGGEGIRGQVVGPPDQIAARIQEIVDMISSFGTTEGHQVSIDLLETRTRALEASAWGERFRFLQPRNVVFWIFLWMCGVGVVKAWQMFAPYSSYFVRAQFVAGVIAVISAAVWTWWFRHIDRHERQPVNLVLTGFVWGGTAATFTIAIYGNTALG